MKIKVTTVDLEIHPRTKRIALMLAIPALAVGGSAIAIAAVPNTFKDGDLLSADKMNQNFADLDSRVVALEQANSGASIITVGNKQYSINGVYCGKTAPVTGAIGGYPAGKTLCEAACSSPSAHMCHSSDLARSAELGIPIANGWYATAAYHYYSQMSQAVFDCGAWTKSSGMMGAGWNAVGEPDIFNCSGSLPILCCDSP